MSASKTNKCYTLYQSHPFWVNFLWSLWGTLGPFPNFPSACKTSCTRLMGLPVTQAASAVLHVHICSYFSLDIYKICLCSYLFISDLACLYNRMFISGYKHYICLYQRHIWNSDICRYNKAWKIRPIYMNYILTDIGLKPLWFKRIWADIDINISRLYLLKNMNIYKRSYLCIYTQLYWRIWADINAYIVSISDFLYEQILT